MSKNNEMLKYQNDSDKRYLPRWEVNNPVYFKLNDFSQPHIGKTKDLSCAGACIYSNKSFSLEENVKLTIFLSEETFVSLNGIVKWVKPLGDENQIGITFSNTDDKALDLILQHAFELDPVKLAKHWFKGWKE